ncbi:hypothetical protein [Poriferisphaera sp. WC338]|uniref:hypothetical protein n=1 Tax=Poriferisphaera sp. WC338 TaxID=3425129 RepID=UPI003D81361C
MVIRFIIITLLTIVLLVGLSAAGGYYFAADAPDGITINQRSLGATHTQHTHSITSIEEAKRTGLLIGAGLGLMQGFIFGLTFAWVDLYVRKKESHTAKHDT